MKRLAIPLLWLAVLCAWVPCASSRTAPSTATDADAILHFHHTFGGGSPPSKPLNASTVSPSQPLSPHELLELRAKLDTTAGRPPIILLPPLSGTQLDAKLANKPDAPHWWCPRWTLGWQLTWLDPFQILPGRFDCFADTLRLHCPGAGAPCTSPPGVAVRPRPGFDSVMAVAESGGQQSAVFGPLVETLERLGWRRGVDILAHGYDWRVTPLDHMIAPDGAYHRLQRQIEGAVHRAQGQRVVVLALSMGAPHFTQFLAGMDDEWRRTHIASFISISGFWGGTPPAILGLVSGVWGGAERLVPGASVKALFRSLPVVSWLLPAEEVYGNDTVFVRNTALEREYRAADMGGLLHDAGASQAADVWRAVRPYLPAAALHPPNVPVLCLHGSNLPTPFTATYSDAHFTRVNVEYGARGGDGTVPQEGLEVCGTWAGRQEGGVTVKAYPGVVHAALLQDGRVMREVVEAVVGAAGGLSVLE